MAAKGSALVREIAAERISILYELAKDGYKENPELSNRYARLIRQISRHYRVKLGKEVKLHICKKCGSFLVPGSNVSVKMISSKRLIAYKCRVCGAEARVHY